MSYETDEQSVEGSLPIELYTMVADGVTLRFTPKKGGYTFESNTYVQAAVARRGIGREAGPGNISALEVNIERGLIDDYAFGVPPNTWTLEIRRVQQSGSQLIWQGSIHNTALQQDGSLLLRSAAITDDQLKRLVPGHIVSRLCPHVLYGPVCRVVRTSFDTITTVSAIAGLVITVAATGGAAPYHDLGEMWFGGQKRMIVKQVGSTLEIEYPFETLAVTNTVTIYAGCTRRINQDCDTKFSNRNNFGGFAFIPASDIYRRGILGGRNI